MKGYYDSNKSVLTSIVVIALFMMIFFWVQSQAGTITVVFSGQPTIDTLTGQLNTCNAALQKYLEVGKAICECKCPDCNTASSVFLGFFFGAFAVAFTVLLFMPWYKKYSADKEEQKKKKLEKARKAADELAKKKREETKI